MLVFHLGDSRYAIPVADVREVAPLVELEPVARTPDYVAGLFNYRGRHAPVIDLCRLVQQRGCADSFTTRIVVVDFPLANGGERPLGLIAEQVTETADMDPDGFSPTGLNVADTPWLDKAAHTEHGLVQQVRIADLLPETVQAQLFSAGDV
jgi:chemotaxis-related protein WspB